MPTETELLADVLAAPDDDAPRRAFAAHWDALGDARGELVRKQLELRELRAREGASTRAIRLFDEAEALAARHGTTWEPRLAALVDRFTFRGGFVELVRLSARSFLDHAAEILSLAPIRHLDLTGAGEVAAALFASPHLATIRSIRLDRGGLGDAEAALLAASPHLGELRWLSLMQNDIGVDGLDAMAASPHLGRLGYVVLTGNRVDASEQYAADQGVILQAWLPDEGRALEAKHGRIPWLHCDAGTLADVPPPRF